MIRLVNIYDDRQDDGYSLRLGAAELLYQLLKERPAEANISHRELPIFEQHVNFLMGRPYQHWYMIESEIAPVDSAPAWVRVGAIGATKLNEITIAILAAHRRKGYARQAIIEFMATHEPLNAKPSLRIERWQANIAPGNEASKALFTGLNFKPTQITYQL